MQKCLLVFMLFTLSLSVHAGRINRIECSGTPNWVHFEIDLVRGTDLIEGQGLENYYSYRLDCDISADGRQIICGSKDQNNQNPKIEISRDSNNIFTATFTGIYFKNLKVGCIARM